MGIKFLKIELDRQKNEQINANDRSQFRIELAIHQRRI